MTINVEVFSSPGCGKCDRASNVVRKVAEEFGIDRVYWREVNVLDELDYVVRLGIFATPSIAIDGKVVFTSLPTARALRKRLQQKLAELAVF